MENEVKESPDSPDPIQESPESPVNELKSPDNNEQEGNILFFEDRTPAEFDFSIPERRNRPRFEKHNNRRRNRKLNRLARTSADMFLEDFIVLDSTEDNRNDTTDDEVTMSTNEPEENTSTSVVEQTEEDLLFVEDRNPQLTGQETQSPIYSIKEDFLKLHSPEVAPKKSRFQSNCWNCGDSSHALRDCKNPRNHAQIARNRREFQQSKASTPTNKRYHEDESQKFAHIIPGELSDELRRALGLGPQQLPPHIYMMRVLGYPPGWLQEAIVPHSGIAMFDGQGKEVADPDAEGGEIIEKGRLDKYDARKIVHYPGFNVPPPPGTYDDSMYWGVPPLSRMQSVEEMLKRLGGRVVGGYKRRKLNPLETSAQFDDSSQSIESQDMEYEETPEQTELPADNCKFVPPLPDEELPPPPPTDLPPPPDSEPVSASQSSSPVKESSLNELEEQKKQLLAQLNDVSPLCNTPKSKVGTVKSVDLGTPILKSISPYDKLPSAEKFSVNICDVINFENLPDSTGKYEQMSGLIRKVRTRLSQLSKEL